MSLAFALSFFASLALLPAALFATLRRFLPYLWPKAGQTAAVPKLSLASLHPQWQWVVGSGIYIDDVDAALEILGRDGLLVGASGNGGDEARRGGVRGGRGGDETATLLGGVHFLDQGDGLAAVLGDIDHTIIDALADTLAAALRREKRSHSLPS